MHKSQLVQILRTFTKKEIRDFKKWLRSPYHNQRKDVYDLFLYLFKNDNLHKENKLIKEYIYPYLFSSEPYDDAKIRQTIHFLFKAIEEFLVTTEMTRDNIQKKIIWSRVLREKGLVEYAQKQLNIVKNNIESKHHFYSFEHHFNKYLLTNELYDTAIVNKRNAQEELENIIDAIDKVFIAERLFRVCIQLSSPNTSLKEDDAVFVEAIIAHLQNDETLLNDQAVKMYFLIYKVLKDNNYDEFLDLKTHLFDFGNNFDQFLIDDIFLIAINYCTRQMNKGRKEYIQEAFSLCKTGIEKKYLISQDQIERYFFRNFVSIGINAREFNWVENFIIDYQQYLDEQHRESYVNFCFGLLYSKSGQYDKAITYLAQFEPDDVLLNLNSKLQLIKIYYQLDEVYALESLIESSKVYLRRKKDIGDNYRLLYKNLLKFTQKLLRVNPYDKSKKAKLRKEIEAANPLIEKQWFLEQLENL